MYIITEFLSLGSLDNFLRQHIDIPKEELISMYDTVKTHVNNLNSEQLKLPQEWTTFNPKRSFTGISN
jgi:hypothetical protein